MKYNKYKIKIWLAALIVLVTLNFGSISIVHADSSEEVGYDIQAIIPENQIDKNNTYFDLRMEPNQKQTIEIMINNTSTEDATYDISVNQAYTSKQGFIDYVESDVALDSSLKYPIKNIITYEKEVDVKAEESIKFPLEIQMPTEQFDGHIMAAIQVVKRNKNQENGVSNQIGYVLGLSLSETDNPVKRDIQLEKVEAAATYGKTSVVAKLKNPTMDAIGKLKYVVDIQDEKTGESVKKATYDSGMELAPNSTYDFAIDWDGKRLIAGNYVMKLTITDAKENKWSFDEKFTITEKEANDINKVTVDVGQKATPIWIYVLIGLIVLLVLLIIVFVILKKKKDKKKRKNRKKRDSKKDQTPLKKTSNRKRKPNSPKKGTKER